MNRPAVLAAAALLAGCASIDTHRQACTALLGREQVADTGKDVPGGPVTTDAKPAPADPQVEACAQQRADAEAQQGRAVAAGILGAILLGAAAGLGASSGYRRPSSYRPAYRYSPAHRPASRRYR